MTKYFKKKLILYIKNDMSMETIEKWGNSVRNVRF
jgi:hypothetical protein